MLAFGNVDRDWVLLIAKIPTLVRFDFDNACDDAVQSRAGESLGRPIADARVAFFSLEKEKEIIYKDCLLYTSPSPRD